MQRSDLTWLRLAGDGILGVAAYFAAFWLRIHVAMPYTMKLLPEAKFVHLPHYGWLIALVQILALYFSGAYDSDRLQQAPSLRATAMAVTVAMLALIAFYFFRNIPFPRTVFLVFWGLDVPLLLAWGHLTFRLNMPTTRRRAVLVGVNHTSAALMREIHRRPMLGLDIVGLVHEEEAPVPVSSGQPMPLLKDEIPILGTRAELAKIIAEHHIDEVILTPTPSWQDQLIDELAKLTEKRAHISIVPSPFEIIIAKPRHRRVHDIPLIDFLYEPLGVGDRIFKRTVDLIGTILLGVVALPVVAIAAVAIKIASPGPVFYRQTRVGRHHRQFSIFKLRTMVPNAEKITGAVLAQRDDPRIYPLGRFLRRTRIDELPQLWNILLGQMSFVGPRPERPEFIETFRHEIPGYIERLRVKPGVTGLAQVNGFYETTPENKLKYDLIYIYNYSFFLDIRILIETVKVVLTARGT